MASAVEFVCDCADGGSKYVVLCENCRTVAFHPGYCDSGLWPRFWYFVYNKDDRAKARRKDWQQWTKEKKIYHCKACSQGEKKVDAPVDTSHVEPTPNISRRKIIKRLASLRKQIKGLRKFFLPGQEEKYRKELGETVTEEDEIEVEEKWLALLESQKPDEVVHSNDPVVEPEAAATKRKKRSREEAENGGDEVEEISKADFRENKQARKIAETSSSKDEMPLDEMELDAENAVPFGELFGDQKEADEEPEEKDEQEPETGVPQTETFTGLPDFTITMAFRPFAALGHWGTGNN